MNKKKVTQHEQTQRVEEHAIFPSHEQRTESKLFHQNKLKLVHEMNLPCYKCYIKHKGNPPPTAYEHREVHHGICEWSAWNAVDPAKVQTLMDGGFFDPYGFAKQMHGQPFESPDDLRNLIVLCVTCHRSEGVGIHHATMPEWMSDMVALDGVDILLTKDEWNMVVTGKAAIAEDGHLVIKESI